MTWSRRRFLAALGGGAALAAGVDGFLIEPGIVTVTRHRFGAAAGPAVRLVQVSDLHLHAVGDHEREVAAEIARSGADLLLLTGDSIERADDLDLLAGFLDLIDPELPKVAILGNWERWAGVDPGRMAEVLDARGGRLLVNQTMEFDAPGGPLSITGLDDLIEGRPDWERATPGLARAPRHLLLEHCPAYRDLLPSGARPDLMLSGHTHGGQVAPFGWAPILPRGSGRYVQGWYRDAGAPPLYVSRGIGTTGIPARFFAPPEIAIFDWAPA